MPSVKNSLSAAALFLALALPVATGSAQTVGDQSALASLSKSAGHTVNIFAMTAKKLFGAQTKPAHMPSLAIGSYAKGCLAGAQALPMTGPNWQVMRPSRNRNWGHPAVIKLLERIAALGKSQAGWNGLLIGDMAQPRGGPMKTGHASHQIGLDADVWFTPMPDHELTTDEREKMVPLMMVKSYKELDQANWSESRAKLLELVAKQPEVARIFVHPPIKAEMCRWSKGQQDRSWLAKIRPLFGHTYHFHVRMSCPAGMTTCENQWTPKPEDGTGCGKELAYWQSDALWNPPKRDPNLPPPPKPKPVPPLTLAGLPAECRAVIAAP